MEQVRHFKAIYKSSYVSETNKTATWDELHRRALIIREDDTLWLMADFTPRVAHINCACRVNWSVWIKDNKPNWTNYFEWTVNAHNAVNIKLGKPIWTTEDASNKWSDS